MLQKHNLLIYCYCGIGCSAIAASSFVYRIPRIVVQFWHSRGPLTFKRFTLFYYLHQVWLDTLLYLLLYSHTLMWHYETVLNRYYIIWKTRKKISAWQVKNRFPQLRKIPKGTDKLLSFFCNVSTRQSVLNWGWFYVTPHLTTCIFNAIEGKVSTDAPQYESNVFKPVDRGYVSFHTVANCTHDRILYWRKKMSWGQIK